MSASDDAAAPRWLVRAVPPRDGDTGAWPGFQARCECELCREGLTTALHADASHDHRGSQTFELEGDAAGPFTLEGGTSKSARALLGHLLVHPQVVRGRRVLELGAGAGLVAIGLARVALPSALLATDQEPVLPLLADNLARHTRHAAGPVGARALTWGVAADLDAAVGWAPELVLGADLNFAREAMAPLLTTILTLAEAGATTVLASVRRARWEARLDEALAERFEHTRLATAGEVVIDRYAPRSPTPA